MPTVFQNAYCVSFKNTVLTMADLKGGKILIYIFTSVKKNNFS